MECPGSHEWYELARGTATREDGERLREHLGACDVCRGEADALADVAASLERLADATRIDVPEEAAESVSRRARVHGLLGRSPRRSWALRLQDPHSRVRWLRWAVPAAVAAALVLLVASVRPSRPVSPVPAGSLRLLADGASKAAGPGDLTALAPLARAAVAEELAQAQPSLDQVGDLVLVAYITQRAREARQAADVRFLLEGAVARRGAAAPRAALRRPWPMLASVSAAAEGLPAAGGADDPLAAAKALVLQGEYGEALTSLPEDGAGKVLKVWCLEALGRRADAALELGSADAAGADGPTVRLLRADLAMQDRNVAEAMHQYEALAGERSRFWFGAGYLCRYELGDLRGAGQRFAHVRDPRLAGYVSRTFPAELAAAQRGPTPLKFDDFESYDLGPPRNWAVVRMRGGEFRVVESGGGKAVEVDELDTPGSEVLTGSADWSDYTFQMDVKVVAARANYLIGALVYRRADQTGYVLELTPHRLRLLKQFAAREDGGKGAPAERLAVEPTLAQVPLDAPPAEGWWYTLKVRVQRVDAGSVALAGKMWRTDTDEPLAWQVIWTDTGQGDLAPLAAGFAGFQIRGATVLVDNVTVTKNELPAPSYSASRGR